jgi:cytochrome-b5 reductase
MKRFGWKIGLGLGLGVCATGLTTFAVFAQEPQGGHRNRMLTEQDIEKLRKGLKIGNTWQHFPVLDVVTVTPDTKVITFGLDPEETFEMKCSQALLGAKRDWSTGRVQRLYTPVTPNGEKGYFEIMVKEYAKGFLSPKLCALKKGDTFEWKNSPPAWRYFPNTNQHVYMIAGGVGITPMLQVIRAALSNDEDTTKLKLLFCNKTPTDIIMKEQLDALVAKHKNRFSVVYCIDKATDGWKGETGYANVDLLMKHFGRPRANDQMLVCGPDPMIKHLCGTPAGITLFWRDHLHQGVAPHHNALPPINGVLGAIGWNNMNCYTF